MLGGPAVDYPAVPFRENVAITADNPRALPVVPREIMEAIHEEPDLPEHGPGRGAAILRSAALKMLAKHLVPEEGE